MQLDAFHGVHIPLMPAQFALPGPFGGSVGGSRGLPPVFVQEGGGIAVQSNCEKLRKIAKLRKIVGNCEKLWEIAKLREIAKNCGPQSPPPLGLYMMAGPLFPAQFSTTCCAAWCWGRDLWSSFESGTHLLPSMPNVLLLGAQAGAPQGTCLQRRHVQGPPLVKGCCGTVEAPRRHHRAPCNATATASAHRPPSFDPDSPHAATSCSQVSGRMRPDTDRLACTRAPVQGLKNGCKASKRAPRDPAVVEPGRRPACGGKYWKGGGGLRPGRLCPKNGPTGFFQRRSGGGGPGGVNPPSSYGYGHSNTSLAEH